MVTDAAGTGFEIKKPHKGTETCKVPLVVLPPFLFEIKKPHKGTETSVVFIHHVSVPSFEIKKPHKGTETTPLVLTLVICVEI